MTNKDIGAHQDALRNAKLVAKLVANDYKRPFSPEVVELASEYNEELLRTEMVLHRLAEALNS
jgi:hypothetical protein